MVFRHISEEMGDFLITGPIKEWRTFARLGL